VSTVGTPKFTLSKRVGCKWSMSVIELTKGIKFKDEKSYERSYEKGFYVSEFSDCNHHDDCSSKTTRNLLPTASASETTESLLDPLDCDRREKLFWAEAASLFSTRRFNRSELYTVLLENYRDVLRVLCMTTDQLYNRLKNDFKLKSQFVPSNTGSLQSLLDELRHRRATEPGFRCAARLVEHDKSLESVVWITSRELLRRGKLNRFIIFDTTFDTNKEGKDVLLFVLNYVVIVLSYRNVSWYFCDRK
jgi:hypothetical protein